MPSGLRLSSLVISHHHSHPILAVVALGTLRSCAGTQSTPAAWHWLLTHLLESSVCRSVLRRHPRAARLERARENTRQLSVVHEAAPVTTEASRQSPPPHHKRLPTATKLSVCQNSLAASHRDKRSHLLHRSFQSVASPLRPSLRPYRQYNPPPDHAFLAAHFSLVITLLAPSRTAWPNPSQFVLSPPGTVLI